MYNLADIIKDWGYLAVFLGSMVEGEIIVVTAGALAACGFMSLGGVFMVSFISTVLTDHGLFWRGRRMGTDWIIRRFPRVKKVIDRVYGLLHRLGGVFIFSFRFIYGIRMASPLILGASGVGPLKFVVYNILSGATWAIICCFVGYMAADVVMDGEFNTMPAAVALSVLVVLVLAAITLFRKTREKA
jgi:membrane protein DedA with SNARE-associated domain